MTAAPSNRNRYDYIVVGAGSAGCVMAARLSEDPQVRVFLLDAGGRDVNPLISIPLGLGKLHAWRMHDWGCETEPEPRSDNRGLSSDDPRERSRISFDLLSDQDDLERLRQGVKLARPLGSQSAMDPFRAGEASPGDTVRTDDQIDAFIRSTALTPHHPSGTCAMGVHERAVVGPDLRVRGVEGPRVIDASVMSTPVSAHPNACVLMLAERGAALVRKASIS